MINLLLSNHRVVVVSQKKKRGVVSLAALGTLPMPTGENFAQTLAISLKRHLSEQKVRDKKLNIILADEVVFKEFGHQPVHEKALLSFARLEAKTVLRTDAGRFSVACMNYGVHQNAQGEETAMLLAAPTLLLKTLRSALQAAGFSLYSVRTLFDSYAAVLDKILPKALPQLTGAAIDFQYEYTLIALYHEGDLVSQRRLPSFMQTLLPLVTADTGCTEQEAYEKMVQNQISPRCEAQLRESFTDYTYDILRTIRVISTPLQIVPQQFLLTGEAARHPIFSRLMVEHLGLPCTLVDTVESAIHTCVTSTGAAGDFLVMAGLAFDHIDLLEQLRQKKAGAAINFGTCALLTVIVAMGMMVMPVRRIVQQSSLEAVQTRYDVLQNVQLALNLRQFHRDRVESIEAKRESLTTAYTGNTSAVLEKVLGLFGEGLNIENLSYSAVQGTYSITFNAYDETYFLALKELLLQQEEYYLSLSLTIERVEQDGSYTCQLLFAAAEANTLPQEQTSSESAVPVQPSAEDLLEAIG